MPENPDSSTTRAIGILFASGLLILFAGMAGLGATAISVAASGEGSTQPAPPASRNPVRIDDKNGSADASSRIRILRRFALGDTTVRKEEGWIFQGPSGRPAGRPVDAAPLADYNLDSR